MNITDSQQNHKNATFEQQNNYQQYCNTVMLSKKNNMVFTLHEMKDTQIAIIICRNNDYICNLCVLHFMQSKHHICFVQFYNWDEKQKSNISAQ